MREPHMSERTSANERTEELGRAGEFEHTAEFTHTAELGHTAEFTPVESPTQSFESPSPGWGAPAWGAPQQQAAYDGGVPAAVVGHPAEPAWAGEPLDQPVDDDEPFVPAKRYRMSRFTKVLVCLCLVLAGALGGAAIQKAVDAGNGAGTTGRNFSQFAPGNGTGTGSGQNGAGTGQNGTGGYGGRNRASQGATAPTAPAVAPSGGSGGN